MTKRYEKAIKTITSCEKENHLYVCISWLHRVKGVFTKQEYKNIKYLAMSKLQIIKHAK